VLHTWTQRLVFHPHVHCLVTGGGLSKPALAQAGDGATWHPTGKTFLFPKSALAALARARFRNAFARLCPDVDLPHHVWQIPWVVHITPWGEGPQAALGYLARYVFRIAITNNRILAIDDATVTYRYKDRTADRQRKETVSGHEFIRRFLQHVLPAGFHKVRYYGLWHAARRDQLCNLRNVLLLQQPAEAPADQTSASPSDAEPSGAPRDPSQPRRCPHCDTGHLTLLRRLSPARPRGP
jgi:hypothetical protein